MNSVIALLARLSGGAWLLDKLNGWKTIIGGSILVLQGLIGLLQSVIGINDLTAVIAFARGIAENPDIGKIAAGLVALGVRHAISKASGSAS